MEYTLGQLFAYGMIIIVTAGVLFLTILVSSITMIAVCGVCNIIQNIKCIFLQNVGYSYKKKNYSINNLE